MKDSLSKHILKLGNIQAFSAFYFSTYKIELLLSDRIEVY